MTDPHIISQNATLIEALGQLNKLSGGLMTLMAVDNEGIMTGTLTDGDVRRALLAGAGLDSRVEAVMHRDFKSMPADDIDVAEIRRLRLARSEERRVGKEC